MISIKKALFTAQVAFLTIFSAFSILAAAGDVDTSFNASANNYFGQVSADIVTQTDGKILIGGIFTVVNGTARHGIARLNADGTVDNSFNPPDLYDTITSALGSTVRTIALQPDGKILVGGNFFVVNSSYRSFIRLNPDGSIDNTLNLNGYGGNESINKILVASDGSIYLGGTFLVNRGDGLFNHQIVKLNANGVPDITFFYDPHSNIVKNLIEQPDGKIVYSDNASPSFPNIKRIHPNGLADNSFGIFASVGSNVERLVAQPDGKILLCGDFTQVNGFTYNRMARINADGSVDVNFNTNMAGASPGAVSDIKVASDGKIVIGGNFTSFNGTARNKIARLNADGTLDASFNFTAGNANSVVRRVAILGSGQILAAGDLTPTPTFDSLLRLNSDGSVDSGFVTKTGKSGRVREILLQPDGKLLIAGEFPVVNGVLRNSLARLNTDGSLDTTFVPYFNSLPANQIIYAIALQSDGKIVVGAQGGITLKRLNADGSQDLTFNPPGMNAGSVFTDLVAQPNGQIVASGGFILTGSGGFKNIGRFNSDGTFDAGFAVPTPNNGVNKIYLLVDGRMYIGGDFTQLGATIRGRIARLNSNGSVDTLFNPPGGANGTVHDIDVQTDGKVVVGGAFFSLNGGTQSRIGRLNSDGTLDASFVQTANVNVLAVKVQSDGKVLIGGQFTVVGGVVKGGIARLNADGSLDSSFNTHALIAVTDINLQTDNKILLGGDFTEINGTSRVGVARLLNSIAPPKTSFDYDGDGKADVSVFRPSTNRWYEFLSSNSTVSEFTFGLAGDVVAPADYDGDGKTDLGIYRGSSGDWWYQSSINGAQISVHWGASGDIPRPSDFDGDGKADYIVFRPSNNVWYRFGSTGATSITGFGLAGDKPVTGDFDGDGKSDLAIFRPSTGDWWYQASMDNSQRAVRWGISTDIPAPADFDGDGKTDFAVYRPSTGVWYVINSGNGSFLIMAFGLAEDKPVPADYDGDGKADIAVFRPSTGTWYQQKTTAGFTAQQFGVGTDIPTENAFVP